MKLKGVWIEGQQIEPLIMEELLKDCMLLNDGRDSTRLRFNHAQKPHRFMIMDVAVVHRLQGKSDLQVTLASQHHPYARHDVMDHLTSTSIIPRVNSRC